MKSELSSEIGWLLRQAYPLRGLYLVRVSMVALTSLLNLVDPLILKWLIDEVLPWHQADMLLIAAGAFFSVFLFRFGFTSLSLMIDQYASQRLMLDIRRRLLRHLQTLSASFHHGNRKGETLHRVEQDVDQICALGGHTLAALLRIAVLSSLTILIMSVLSWQLTLFVLPLIPLMLLLRRFSQPHLRRASDRAQTANGRRVAFLQDHLFSILQVQLLNRGAGERRRFTKLSRDGLEAAMSRQARELQLSFSSQLALVTASALVLGFGGHQVLAGALTIGGLVAFYSYLTRIFQPMESAVEMYSQLQRAAASIRRVRALLQTRSQVAEPDEPRRWSRRSGPLTVELQDVRFEYQPDQPVLDMLQLSIAAGQRVALVGTSGSGKSTVSQLLTRMYDPLEGRILLDGICLTDLRLKDLRSAVALVLQEPVIFDTSLEENLRYAARGVTPDQIDRVLELVQLRQTVDRFTGRRQEQLGPRGERLSGGQRQRLAIARAVLQKPRLLILDEATSGLDGLTEQRLLRRLDDALVDCTVLMIAHRLSVITWADRILVLDHGRIIADGNHHDLYRSCRLYRQMCEEQLEHDTLSSDPLANDRSEESPLAKVVAL